MLLVMPILAFFSTKAFANAEVTLTDNTDAHIATVSIAHKDETLNAIDMEIVFSNNINILNLDSGNLDCSMNNSITENGNKIEILCLSDADLAETGTIAEISYEVSNGSDYYFYVDQSTLDLGDIVIKKVTDINKPVSIANSDSQLNENTQEGTMLGLVLDFLKDYYVYIISGAFILALIVILLTSIKKEKDTTDTPTPATV
jgi:hypothetical protein